MVDCCATSRRHHFGSYQPFIDSSSKYMQIQYYLTCCNVCSYCIFNNEPLFFAIIIKSLRIPTTGGKKKSSIVCSTTSHEHISVSSSEIRLWDSLTNGNGMFPSESSNESSCSAHEVLVGFQLEKSGVK